MIADPATVLHVLVGLPLFLAILALGGGVLTAQAARHHLLKPVLAGLALRLVVMAGAHIASVLAGGHGFFFLDDSGYDAYARAISGAWAGGSIINPGAVEYAGSMSAGYPVLVSSVYLLVGPVVFAAKLVNVLLGGAVVLVTGLLAGRLLGERAKVATAWVAALLPTLVWWSGPMMKEALVALLLTGGLLLALSLPRRTALIGLLAIVVGLLSTRIQAAAVLVATVAVVGIAAASEARRRRVVLVVLAGGCLLLLGGLALNGGSAVKLVEGVLDNGARMISVYDAAHPGSLPYDIGASLLGPLPWVFSSTTYNWDLALYPGVWVLYALYPTIVVGAWRLRRRPWVLAYLALPIGAFVVVNSIFAGLAIRQRVTIEPLLVLLAVAGADSWRAVARRGAFAIALAAPVAALHVRSLPTGAAIAGAAIALWLLAARLPATRSELVQRSERAPPLDLDVRGRGAWAALRGLRPRLAPAPAPTDRAAIGRAVDRGRHARAVLAVAAARVLGAAGALRRAAPTAAIARRPAPDVVVARAGGAAASVAASSTGAAAVLRGAAPPGRRARAPDRLGRALAALRRAPPRARRARPPERVAAATAAARAVVSGAAGGDAPTGRSGDSA